MSINLEIKRECLNHYLSFFLFSYFHNNILDGVKKEQLPIKYSVGEEDLKRIYKEIHLGIKKYDYNYISKMIRQYFLNTKDSKKSKPKSLREVMKHNRSFNLVDKDEFYYHNTLRIMPPPPKSRLDENGIPVVEYEEFYLEIVEEFTLLDLLDYACDNLNIDKKENYNRELRSLEFLVNKNGLDSILYAIDCAVDHNLADDNPLPDKCIQISDYINVGRQRLSTKIQEAKIHGLNKQIPRQKVC